MKATETQKKVSQACLSDCEKYRYWLSRIWDKNCQLGAFICLNPSKATSEICDPTMCNCNNLAVQWGWGGFFIINLFAFRATNQSELMNPKVEPVGELNDQAIKFVSKKVKTLVLAWGQEKNKVYRKRVSQVLEILGDVPLYCLEENNTSGYLHPGFPSLEIEKYTAPKPC